MQKEIEVQQENLQELFRLIKENPDLPIVPMVDEDVVADYGYQRWKGSWGKAQKTKYCMIDEYVHFYEPDDWNAIESALSALPDDAYIGFYNVEDEDEDETRIKEMYETLPWVEAIVVYIDLPN